MESPVKSIRKSDAIAEKVRRFRQKMNPVFRVRDDERQAALMDLLCDALRRYLEAQQAIHADGLLVPGRAGEKKRNPALLTERDARIAMLKLLEQLSAGKEKSKKRIDAAEEALEDALTQVL